MANFFQNKQDLAGWIKSRESGDGAATELVEVIKMYHNLPNDIKEQNDIKETCKQIFSLPLEESENASNVLFNVLAKHKLTTVSTKESSNKSVKVASKQSRQRNDWVRGMRNKWNRVVDGFNEGTPWRAERDKMYDFTHYYTDAITFDEDPTHVYSGEAMWRMYMMDKFSSECQDKNGRWVGGYINNRYFVFPDAGTPDNQDVDRMGGNQMQLAPGERTRLPRPHQYSTERRLEEARGNKSEDVMVTATGFNKVFKISSKIQSNQNDEMNIYAMLKDCIEMKEANFSFEERIELISEHYNTTVDNVAQIDKVASSLKEKHNNIGYVYANNNIQKSVYPKTGDLKAPTQVEFSNGRRVLLPEGTTIVYKNNGVIQVVDTDSEFNGQECVTIENAGSNQINQSTQQAQPINVSQSTQLSNFEQIDSDEENIQKDSDELGLNE